MRFAHALAMLAVATSLSVVASGPPPPTDVPTKVNFQGYLTSGGTPVNGTVSITVSLYAAPTGGTPLWSENESVSAANGIYNVVLGNTTPLDETVLTGPRYLGVTVGTDAEMTPRVQLVSAPYALMARSLDPAVQTLTIQSQLNVTVQGVQFSGGNIGMGPAAGLSIGGNQVVGAQQPGMPDFGNATGVDGGNAAGVRVVTVAEFNALAATLSLALDRLRAHGLISVATPDNSPLLGVALSPMSLAASATGPMLIQFTPQNPWPAGGILQIDFPGSFDFSSATVAGQSFSGTLALSVQASSLILTRGGGGSVDIAGTPVQITLGGVKNPSLPGTIGPFFFQTEAGDGTPISSGTAPLVVIQ